MATSRGPLEIDYNVRHSENHDAVKVTTFDADGWQGSEGLWSTKHGYHHAEETLPDFIAGFVGLPAEEAQRLAGDIQGAWAEEWKRRSGAEDARMMRRWLTGAVGVIVVVLSLALIGLVTLVRDLAF